jgi:hypothetical protein
MSRTFRGLSGLKSVRSGNQILRSQAALRRPLSLSSMHGEVHRFEGVIDRFGSAIKSTGIIQTVCVRDLRHCRTGQHLSIDHWWFRLRQEWMHVPLMPGDQVMFTAKIQRCSKGWNLVEEDGSLATGRHQLMGFGSRVQDLVVKSSSTNGRTHSFHAARR